MARNVKCRRVCAEPACCIFTPQQENAQYVSISVDELEAMRLSDLEGLDQDTAANQMNISRGTFQRTLYAARRKTVEALCFGKGIRIGGGNYEICTPACAFGVCKACVKQQTKQEMKHNE